MYKKEGHHRVSSGKVFEHFKEKEKFIKMVGKLKIHKSTIVFKINVFKLLEKHPKLAKSSVTLTILRKLNKFVKRIQANLSE